MSHTMSLLFSPITLSSPRGPLTLPNRIVVAPMCQYACHLDGKANDWHLMHWANLLNSGAGVFMMPPPMHWQTPWHVLANSPRPCLCACKSRIQVAKVPAHSPGTAAC